MSITTVKLIIIAPDVTDLDPNHIFPGISNYFVNCEVTNKLSNIKFKDIINSKNYFYYSKYICKSFQEKIIHYLISLYRKNLNSINCKFQKEISKTLLKDKSEIKLISFGTYILREMFIFNTQNLNMNVSIFDFSSSPLKYLWLIEILKLKLFHKKNKSTEICILYNCFSTKFLKYIQTIYPKAKVISRYHDMTINDKQKRIIQKSRKHLKNIKFESYSSKEAEFFNIAYQPNSVYFEGFSQIKANNTQQYDIYFMGVYSESRYEFIKNFLIKINRLNLKIYMDFIVLPNTNQIELKHKVTSLKLLNQQNLVVNTDPVNYIQYLKNLALSKTILDVYRLFSDEGLSFRTAEALALKKKMITNRDLNANNLYKFKENILTFDEIDKVDLREFIDKTYVDLDPELLKQFDINEQIKNYLKN